MQPSKNISEEDFLKILKRSILTEAELDEAWEAETNAIESSEDDA